MNPRIFQAAAEAIETGRQKFACIAIDRAAGVHHSLERKLFNRYFSPVPELDGAVANHIAYFSYDEEDEDTSRNYRVLALCFAAVITKNL